MLYTVLFSPHLYTHCSIMMLGIKAKESHILIIKIWIIVILWSNLNSHRVHVPSHVGTHFSFVLPTLIIISPLYSMERSPIFQFLERGNKRTKCIKYSPIQQQLKKYSFKLETFLVDLHYCIGFEKKMCKIYCSNS